MSDLVSDLVWSIAGTLEVRAVPTGRSVEPHRSFISVGAAAY